MVKMNCIVRILLLTCALCFIEATQSRWPHRSRKISSILAQDKSDACMLDRISKNSYGGNVSVTVKGRTCFHWNRIPTKRHLASSFWNCSHNYCRNPDKSIQPWCMVRKGRHFVREYCDVPPTTTKPPNSSPTIDPSKQDTESTCGERNLPRISKIIGGLRSSVESHPWIAAIFFEKGFVCGGTLISPCWVLTAAHCFSSGKRTRINKYSVYLGKNAINETDSKEQKFSVSKLVIHSGFNYSVENYNHDIALLQIVNSDGQCALKMNSVRTACLPPSGQMVPSGFYCEIAGYGRYKRDGSEFSRHLKTAQVKLISQTDCQKYYNEEEEVSGNMFCAAGRNWEDDACQGDSGGPLVCEINNTMFLFGIISWGKYCAKESNPGVYTKVTNYNNWISQHTNLPAYTAGSRYPQKN